MTKQLEPMTRNLLCVLDSEGMIKISKNKDRGASFHLDNVFKDLKFLADSGDIRLFESSCDPKEVIVLKKSKKVPNSFIV